MVGKHQVLHIPADTAIDGHRIARVPPGKFNKRFVKSVLRIKDQQICVFKKIAFAAHFLQISTGSLMKLSIWSSLLIPLFMAIRSICFIFLRYSLFSSGAGREPLTPINVILIENPSFRSFQYRYRDPEDYFSDLTSVIK